MSGGFFGHDAGQERRKRLDAIAQKLVEGAQYYAGPGFSMNAISQALSMANPIQDVGEAMGNARDGNYVGAAVNTASALAPVGAWKLAGSPMDDVANVLADTMTGVGMKAQGAMDAGRAFAGDEFGGVGPSGGIRAYHGSPHDFDKFSMDAIGTGEGAQAYGHGLYFAENEGVARGYRDALRWQGSDWDDPRYVARFWLDKYKGDPQAAAQYLEGTIKHQSTDASKSAVSEAIGILKQGGTGLDAANPGSMYEVRINANPDDFLDWDAPLSGQSPKVRTAAEKQLRKYYGSQFDGQVGNTSRRPLGELIDQTDRNEVRKAAQLQEQGVAGIKYRDAGSRGMDGNSGTRNYVVFDENLIEIVRKYGIAGAAALLGVSASEVQAAMGQRE
jgi:hypothetical protein